MAFIYGYKKATRKKAENALRTWAESKIPVVCNIIADEAGFGLHATGYLRPRADGRYFVTCPDRSFATLPTLLTADRFEASTDSYGLSMCFIFDAFQVVISEFGDAETD